MGVNCQRANCQPIKRPKLYTFVRHVQTKSFTGVSAITVVQKQRFGNSIEQRKHIHGAQNFPRTKLPREPFSDTASLTTMVVQCFSDVFKGRPFSSEHYLPLQSLSTQNGRATIVHQPELFDILCGKDKSYSSHPGNRAFREVIESMVAPYEKAFKKQDKMRLMQQIVTTLKRKFNSCFLRRISNNCSCIWQEISDSMARDKVSHALRFAAGRKSTNASRKSINKNKLLPSVNVEMEQVMSRGVGCVSSSVHVEKSDSDSIPEMGNEVEFETLCQRQQAIVGALRKDLPAHEALTAVNVLAEYFAQKPDPTPDSSDSVLALLNEPLLEW